MSGPPNTRRKHRAEITELLESIGRALRRPVRVYILGGAALTLRGIKDSTVDVDIIVEDQDSYNALAEALRSLGFYRESSLRFANPVTMDCVDVDVGKFIKLRLYEELREGSERLGVFGNLDALLLPNESIILYKALTERERDLDDIAAIIRERRVNWDRLVRVAVVVTERELESKRGEGVVLVYELLVTLERINEKHPGLVPSNILSRLEKIADRYVKLWLRYARRHQEESENEDRHVPA